MLGLGMNAVHTGHRNLQGPISCTSHGVGGSMNAFQAVVRPFSRRVQMAKDMQMACAASAHSSAYCVKCDFMSSPKPSQKRSRPRTFPLSKFSQDARPCCECCLLMPSGAAGVLLEKRHTRTPTHIFFLRPISLTFLSSHTLNPSLTFSLSIFLFLCTIPPAVMSI